MVFHQKLFLITFLSNYEGYFLSTPYPEIARGCERAANYENMLAHGISCSARIEKYEK